MNDITITVTLDRKKSWALAQFLKRVCWEDVRARAVDADETELMMDAMIAVQDALRQKGVWPR